MIALIIPLRRSEPNVVRALALLPPIEPAIAARVLPSITAWHFPCSFSYSHSMAPVRHNARNRFANEHLLPGRGHPEHIRLRPSLPLSWWGGGRSNFGRPKTCMKSRRAGTRLRAPAPPRRSRSTVPADLAAGHQSMPVLGFWLSGSAMVTAICSAVCHFQNSLFHLLPSSSFHPSPTHSRPRARILPTHRPESHVAGNPRWRWCPPVSRRS